MNKTRNQTTLGEQLKEKAIRKEGKVSRDLQQLISESETRKTNRHYEQPKRSPVYYEDGRDHINVDRNGATDLGKALAIDGEYNFTLPVYGEFSSILNLMTYLTTIGHPEFLRHASPHVLRTFARNRDDNGQWFDHPNVHFICAYVLMDRIENDSAISESLIDASPAPFTSYYLHNGFQRKSMYAHWWLDVVLTIQSDLLNGRQPSVNAFSSQEDMTFEKACIPLDKPKSLGVIKRKEPVTDKTTTNEPTNKKEKKQKKEKDLTSALNVRYLKKDDLEVNVINTRLLGVAGEVKYGEVFQQLLDTDPEALKEAIMSYSPEDIIPFSITDDEISEDEVKKTFVMMFDPVTHQFVGLSTCLLDNPLAEDMSSPFELSIDAPNLTKATVAAAIRTALGLEENTFIRVYDVEIKEEAAAMTESSMDESPVDLKPIEPEANLGESAPDEAQSNSDVIAQELTV